MNEDIEEHLSKSRTTYRNLHHLQPSTLTNSMNSSTDDDDDNDDGDSTLPTFVNQFFSPKNPLVSKSPPAIQNNETGMFRAIRGQVIIHHDDDRSSKVQCEEEEEEDVDNEIERIRNNRSNMGNYELHYDIDNPLEISCSMSLSSAETVSDHSPSPIRHTSSLNLERNNIQSNQPIELSTSDDDHDIPSTSSSLTNNNHHEQIDNDDDQDEKLRTFRGWHLSMLKQIDEKLREIELDSGGTNAPATTTTITNSDTNFNSVIPVNTTKKTVASKKKLLRPTIRRRFEISTNKRSNSPISHMKINSFRQPSPTIEKESRTLVINLPPSSSSSSSDNDEDFPPPPPPAPSEPIHIRIVKSPICTINQRSQSTDRLILRDQSAQTEPTNAFEDRSIRSASVDYDRLPSVRSLTRTQGNQFLRQQQQQQPFQQQQQVNEPIKFYSLRSRNIQSRPSIVTQSPMSTPQLVRASPTIPNRLITNEKPIPSSLPTNNLPMKSPDPSVYADDYGQVTQMDTTNLGCLVDKVFDDIYQDKPSDFYRDYRQLLHDIQIRFSMITTVEQPTINHHRPPPPPPPPPIHRPVIPPPPPPPLAPQPLPPPPSSSLSSQPVFVDYSRLNQPSIPQTRLLDTLIYIPNPI